MAAEKMMRLSKVARELNVGKTTIIDFLATKGYDIENNPNAKINVEQFNMLSREFATSAQEKKEASELTIGTKRAENIVIESAGAEGKPKEEEYEEEDKVLIKSVSTKSAPATEEPAETPKKETPKPAADQDKKEEEEKVSSSGPKLQGIKVLGKIDLEGKKGKASSPKKETEKKEEKTKTSQAPFPKKEVISSVKEETIKAKEVTPTPEKEKASSKKVETAETEKKKPIEAASEEKTQEKAETPSSTKPKVEEAKEKEVPAEEKTTPAVKAKKEDTPDKPQTEEKKPKKKAIGEEAVSKKVEKAPKEEIKSEKSKPQEVKPAEKAVEEKVEEQPSKVIEAKADQLKGLTVLGKIELPAAKSKKKAKPVASSDDKKEKKKSRRPRKRITKPGQQPAATGEAAKKESGQAAAPKTGAGGRGTAKPFQKKERFKDKSKRGGKPAEKPKAELTDKEIQDQIKATLARLSGGGGKGASKASRSKYRKEKRSAIADAREEQILKAQEEAKTLRVTEFISANDLANLMEVSVNDVISTCMGLGMFISINQRLDAEAITLIADEFGFDVDFSSTDEDLVVEEVVDKEEDLVERAPIVTIMGHVDHGKTSLLDFIRSASVASGEAGGITQHIGAYDVTTSTGKRIAFLDTPGHEAFTAMRARGAKVTDVAIIVVAADDDVMPQTREAINHAQVADVPIVIAINKIDKPNANPEKIRESLAKENILVEDWGGKYQCQEISAKSGQGIEELLEKVLLESELLELKANPNKKAVGAVIEASLDKGRGYVSTLLVESGTLKVGDTVLAGAHFGKVKALYNHLGRRLEKAGPATPVQMLGLNGAPQAGDKFNVMESDREAREMATKREQLLREQSVRTRKHITLDEIGRRLAIGSFQELNIIIKGDVDGSVEALSDSLLKLSTDEVQINIIHKAVGQITESDVLLASASDAIILGFQVRPSAGARRIAENEEIEIRMYSIIYQAIEELKDAMEGMLAPEVEEVIVGNVEVRDVFKISKVGTVAGCYVTDGYVKRHSKVRLIRDGIVIYNGEINQLKRFKEDVGEVKQGYECGLSIVNFNDIKIGDNVEVYEERETKRKL
ncbi:translation initiation factor IF-2 [Xanthovirga aplysinae]|uniref:translation initiation factor IF-2 n=1 Tax=Xanthovirga aplysinae TaxID=2529853 RepID=UPI0012BD18A8|nr:translation initiation factor IF-2 [Xanthovirga aplysinae]MTI30781.1 translation initiation factor IF-2 [Xanthovirga aplysinae]